MTKTTFGLPKKREQVMNLLQQAYVDQNLDDADYERRLTLAMEATSVEDLQAILSDFPNAPQLLPQMQSRPASSGMATRSASGMPSISQSMGAKRSVSVLGEKKLEIKEELSKELRISTFLAEQRISLQQASVMGDLLFISVESALGSTIIDLRGEMLANKHIEISLMNFMGEVRILLPKGAQVDNEITSILGEVKHSHQKVKKWFKKLIGGGSHEADQPVIPFKVTLYGSCILGEVKLMHD